MIKIKLVFFSNITNLEKTSVNSVNCAKNMCFDYVMYRHSHACFYILEQIFDRMWLLQKSSNCE